MKAQAHSLIQQYYDAFNTQNKDALLALLSDDIVHDINQGPVETGKQAFSVFMDSANASYRENVTDLIIMANEDYSHVATKFTVKGTYLKTADGLPKANGQTYTLPCGAFLEIKKGKISWITVYYNLQDWLKQVSQ